jgi:DeoR family deoxyribose operon repressor
MDLDLNRTSLNRTRRIEEISNTLRLRTVVSTKELSRRFGVSEMTIRRDLNLLTAEGVVNPIPGGAVLKIPDSEDPKYVITREASVRSFEKLKIGKRAASLIAAGETVILDSGTTTEYMARYIPDEIPITVVCYTLNALVEVFKKKSSRIIFAGGHFHPETMTFESEEAASLLHRTRADKVFASAAAIHDKLGVTTVYHHELELKKAILSTTTNRILLADSSKFGKTKSVYFAALTDFQTIITDSGIPDDYIRSIHDLGIELIIV